MTVMPIAKEKKPK